MRKLTHIASETEREMVSKESFFEDEEVWLKAQANFLSTSFQLLCITSSMVIEGLPRKDKEVKVVKEND